MFSMATDQDLILNHCLLIQLQGNQVIFSDVFVLQMGFLAVSGVSYNVQGPVCDDSVALRQLRSWVTGL